MMLNVGDIVFDKQADCNVQILEKIDVWGYISYKVFNSATGKVYKVNEDQLTLIGETGKYNEDYLRYVILLRGSGLLLVSHLVQKHKNNCSRCGQMLGRGGRRSDAKLVL